VTRKAVRVKRAMTAVAMCLGLCPSVALAIDWSATGTLSQITEMNDNEFLNPKPMGGTLNSYSTLSANTTARTPDSFFSFDGNIGYRKYFGGLEPGQESEALNAGVKLHYEMQGKNPGDRTYFETSWQEGSAQFALLGELGLLIPVNGFLDRTTVVAGIDRSLTSSDFVSLSARSSYSNYDPSGGGPAFTDTSVSGQWRHRIDGTFTLVGQASGEMLDFNNALNSRLTILQESGGFDATLSPLLSFHGTFGVASSQVVNGVPALSLSSLPTAASSAWNSGFITDMLLSYKMYQDTTVRLIGKQSVGPTFIGSLFETSTLRGELTKTINSRQSITLATDANRIIQAGTTTDFMSASVSYHVNLTHEWSAGLTYRFLHRFGTSEPTATTAVDLTGIPVINPFGPANSNSIMAVVSRTANLLPNGNP
jgi:hypothetical protein